MYISALRSKKGLSQSDLAEILRVSLRTIQNWEQDPANLPRKKAAYVAEFFGVTVESLYDEEDTSMMVNEPSEEYGLDISQEEFQKILTGQSQLSAEEQVVILRMKYLEKESQLLDIQRIQNLSMFGVWKEAYKEIIKKK